MTEESVVWCSRHIGLAAGVNLALQYSHMGRCCGAVVSAGPTAGRATSRRNFGSCFGTFATAACHFCATTAIQIRKIAILGNRVARNTEADTSPQKHQHGDPTPRQRAQDRGLHPTTRAPGTDSHYLLRLETCRIRAVPGPDSLSPSFATPARPCLLQVQLGNRGRRRADQRCRDLGQLRVCLSYPRDYTQLTISATSPSSKLAPHRPASRYPTPPSPSTQP